MCWSGFYATWQQVRESAPQSKHHSFKPRSWERVYARMSCSLTVPLFATTSVKGAICTVTGYHLYFDTFNAISQNKQDFKWLKTQVTSTWLCSRTIVSVECLLCLLCLFVESLSLWWVSATTVTLLFCISSQFGVCCICWLMSCSQTLWYLCWSESWNFYFTVVGLNIQYVVLWITCLLPNICISISSQKSSQDLLCGLFVFSFTSIQGYSAVDRWQ